MKPDSIIDRGIIPDFIMRRAMKAFFTGHKRAATMNVEERHAVLMNLIDDMKSQPVALLTSDTKRQHYEVPTEFFKLVLGPSMKYSCCYWERSDMSYRSMDDLAEAETAMLDLTVQRAGIADGQNVLDLGCGWGSLTIFIARRFPLCRVTAVSHSSTQKACIEARALELGLNNVNVITADMNDFDTDDRFNRIVSVEMFEHMRNYEELMNRISRWLVPGGKLFVHIFTIDGLPYYFDSDSDEDWMGRMFFAGGIMPSTDLLLYFTSSLSIERTWKVSGHHYEKTLLSWLHRMDTDRSRIMPILEKTYGPDASRWWNRWRMFFLSCATAFGFRQGRVWNVTHYLFTKKQ